jgi:hypothetical protein
LCIFLKVIIAFSISSFVSLIHIVSGKDTPSIVILLSFLKACITLFNHVVSYALNQFKLSGLVSSAEKNQVSGSPIESQLGLLVSLNPTLLNK